jgi:hypothetical protein
LTGKPILAMRVPVHHNGKIAYNLNVGFFPDRVAALLHAEFFSKESKTFCNEPQLEPHAF